VTPFFLRKFCTASREAPWQLVRDKAHPPAPSCCPSPSNRPPGLKLQPVKPLAKVPAVDVGHRPHGPDDAAKTAVQHRGGEVERLVGVARVGELGGMRSGEKGEFGGRKTTSRDVEQRQAVVPVQPERRVERPSGDELDRAGHVGKAVLLETVDDRRPWSPVFPTRLFTVVRPSPCIVLISFRMPAEIVLVICYEEQRWTL
jgi:hypothetical protein